MPPKSKIVETSETSSLDALTASVKTMAASVEAMREELATSNLTINNLTTRLVHIENILKTTHPKTTTSKRN